MSYDPSSLDEPKNYVRLLISDTTEPFALSDEEITFFIDNEVNALFAAARAADVLAARHTGSIRSKSAHGKSVSYDSANDYRALAAKLRADARRESPGKPYAGGISKKDKERQEQLDDRVKPGIRVGIHDKDDFDPIKSSR